VRPDGRKDSEMRAVKVTRNFIDVAEGSVLIELGKTRVICTASIEEKVPPFLKDQNRGWVTAEYSMLPRATQVRTMRESTMGRIGGRTQEIQRLIGRALRSVVDLRGLGQRTVWLDCDVIQAAITGAFICLNDALETARQRGIISGNPVRDWLAAVSVGIIDGEPRLDLCYLEDSSAEVDMNVVMTGKGDLVEVQGTAEGAPFSREALDGLLLLATRGIEGLIEMQKGLIATPPGAIKI
jgi:ribonuclease PH